MKENYRVRVVYYTRRRYLNDGSIIQLVIFRTRQRGLRTEAYSRFAEVSNCCRMKLDNHVSALHDIKWGEIPQYCIRHRVWVS